jgi:hypothetical protein
VLLLLLLLLLLQFYPESIYFMPSDIFINFLSSFLHLSYKKSSKVIPITQYPQQMAAW